MERKRECEGLTQDRFFSIEQCKIKAIFLNRIKNYSNRKKFISDESENVFCEASSNDGITIFELEKSRPFVI